MSESDEHSAYETQRKARLEERYLPPWVVMEAVGRAIGEDIKGLERRGDSFAVLVDVEVSDE